MDTVTFLIKKTTFVILSPYLVQKHKAKILGLRLRLQRKISRRKISLLNLKINHRTHSQEGALPILFSFIALEATMILPDYMAIIDTYAIPAEVFTYMSRFSVLGTAVVFLFASIQFYGTNLSRSWLYLAFALASVVYITFALPLDASSSDAIFSSSDYGDIVIVCYLIINIAAIATYAVSVIKDRATHSPFRSLAYTLLIIGNIMSLGYNPIPSIISVVIYIAGIIMLGITAKNSF